MINPRKAKNIGVWGAGKSGIAAAELLLKHQAKVTLYDRIEQQQLEEKLGDRAYPIVGGRLNFDGHDLIVLSPGIPPHSSDIKGLIKSGIPFMSEVELGLEYSSSPFVAVTGTDGKSTTSDMINHVMNHSGRKSVVCGNFGIPVCDVVLNETPPELLVVEISAFQLWSTRKLRPRVAVVTNIAHDHLDYFEGSFEAYCASKLRICADMTEGLVVARSDLRSRFLSLPPGVHFESFSAAATDADWSYTDRYLCFSANAFMSSDDLKVVGRHNVNNALSAAATAREFAIPFAEIADALSTYTGLPHRMEFVRQVDGVSYFNDSKATNPHAALTGIESMDGPLIVIAGGYDKGLDLDEFAQALATCKSVILTGPVGQRLISSVENSQQFRWVESLSEAIEYASQSADPGDKVLFSPGASSFDAFSSFEQRGDLFRELVVSL